jgi:hypothetical protein
MAKAHRTYWRIRQRYRRAGFAGSMLGGFVAAALIAPAVHSADWAAQPFPLVLVLQWLALFLGAVALPPLAAKLAWRVHRRRYLEDIYEIAYR